MEKRKRILIMGLFINLIIASFMANTIEAYPKVSYGQVVGIQFTVLQVRADDGRISVFWLGYKTNLDSRLPFLGDRVKIEYIKDMMGRNAVTRIRVLKKG
ncbi:MAG: hypothetical protein KGZ49_08535 [Syntrophaceae bacterium]|nr:hypothetical protein [Syntrophaceae bacterium]